VNRKPTWLLALLILTVFSGVYAFGVAVADGSWLKNVPAHEHEKTNPFAGQPDAIAAGQRIYLDHCSHCHGENAEGTKKHPALKSERVQHQASEGDLRWLLVNGNMRKGMPSWSKLPDQQVWQLIAYLKSMHN
jgi:cytochrome c oxidase cbb3-type subunit 3